jgi:hypothetical protein
MDLTAGLDRYGPEAIELQFVMPGATLGQLFGTL